MKLHRLRMIVLLVVMIFFVTVFYSYADTDTAGQNSSDAASSGGAQFEQISASEWRILNESGDFIGTLKSSSGKTFTFYDSTGVLIGAILEDKSWRHRLYRKRDTRVQPEEARLYVEALKVIDAIR